MNYQDKIAIVRNESSELFTKYFSTFKKKDVGISNKYSYENLQEEGYDKFNLSKIIIEVSDIVFELISGPDG